MPKVDTQLMHKVRAIGRVKAYRGTCRKLQCDASALPGRRGCAVHVCRNHGCSRGFIHNDGARAAYCGRCVKPTCGYGECKVVVLDSLDGLGEPYRFCTEHQHRKCAIAGCEAVQQALACPRHRCSAECAKPGRYRDGRCPEHSVQRCGLVECKNERQVDRVWCVEHVCLVPGCSISAELGGRCAKHRCAVYNCVSACQPGTQYCTLHTCSVVGCVTQTSLFSRLCYVHKCLRCGDVAVNRRLCARHQNICMYLSRDTFFRCEQKTQPRSPSWDFVTSYCTKHSCPHIGCTDDKTCTLHRCVKCGTAKDDTFRFCTDHKCPTPTCDNMRTTTGLCRICVKPVH